MFPNAQKGYMPYAPSYEERKKKAERKHRHSSGPSQVDTSKSSKKCSTICSMPALNDNKDDGLSHSKFTSLPNNLDTAKQTKDKSFLSTIMNVFGKKSSKEKRKDNTKECTCNGHDQDQETEYQAKRLRQDSTRSRTVSTTVVMESIAEERESEFESISSIASSRGSTPAGSTVSFNPKTNIEIKPVGE